MIAPSMWEGTVLWTRQWFEERLRISGTRPDKKSAEDPTMKNSSPSHLGFVWDFDETSGISPLTISPIHTNISICLYVMSDALITKHCIHLNKNWHGYTLIYLLTYFDTLIWFLRNNKATLYSDNRYRRVGGAGKS